MTWSSRNPDAFGQPLVGGGLLRRPGAGAGSSSAVWSWEVSSRFGYAFTGDWGPVESSWDGLPHSWNPESFRPRNDSLAAVGVVRSGILDHGVWSGRCYLRPMADYAGDLVDVAVSVDLLCTDGLSSPMIGALRAGEGQVDWTNTLELGMGLGPAAERRAQPARRREQSRAGAAFGRIV